MKRIISLLALALTVLLQANAQEQWNAVKVFDLDVDDAASVYNMYIDSVGTTDGGALFCFQTDSNCSPVPRSTDWLAVYHWIF